MKIISRSSSETKKFAADLAKKLLKPKTQNPKATIVALSGDLGAGKTTFAQGFAKGLGIKHRIVSPTFLIFRKYENFYHVDLYRIHSPKELNVLGFKKIIKDQRNLVLIEWAEKIKKLLPINTVWVNFTHCKKENERLIDVRW